MTKNCLAQGGTLGPTGGGTHVNRELEKNPVTAIMKV